jgi:hypothetical protein
MGEPTPLTDRPFIRNLQNYAPNSNKSAAYKKRTKSAGHQLWRERGIDRVKWPWAGANSGANLPESGRVQ